MSEFNPAEADKELNNPQFNLDDDVNVAEKTNFREPGVTAIPVDYDDGQQRHVDVDDEDDAYSSIGMNAVVNQPQEPDDNLPRYGMSGLLPISLMKQVGNNSWCDFNKKDSLGRTIVNYNWYPAFTLIPIFGGSFEIPYENLPTYSEEPMKAAPFDLTAFNEAQKNRDGFERAKRTARQCSEIFMRENRSAGGVVLYSLTGYGAGDADKGFSKSRRLVETILPFRDRSIYAVTERVRAGVPFKGPFLDDLVDDVKQNGIMRLRAAGYSTDAESVEMKCYAEIRQLLVMSVKRANAFVDESEGEMKKVDGLKRTYDPSDLETYDAPVSTDLYCLAHVNRYEIDEKQLRASETIGREVAHPMEKALDKFSEAVEKIAANNIPAGVAASGIPTDQVESMIAQAIERTRIELSQEFDEKLAAATAGGGKKPK